MAPKTTRIVSRGRPVEAAGHKIIPVSRATIVSGAYGGVVLNRPSEVVVEGAGSLPISNTAGRLQVGLWAIGVGGAVAAWWMRRRRRRR